MAVEAGGIEALLEELRPQLQQGLPIRRKLPDGGRLHIDRALPFVCLYRRPTTHPDAGTPRLLLGEASYLIVGGASAEADFLQPLLSAICEAQSAAFGASLLLELWAGEAEAEADFTIVAPQRNADGPWLEQFEDALLGIRIAERTPRVDLEYRETIAPPGMTEPLPGLREIHRAGLVVRPHYREPVTGEIYPFRLRELQRGLAHALKRALHAFSHRHTRHRPAHFHELGRHAMTAAVFEADRRLAQIDAAFDLLLHVTPVNASEAWAAFRDAGYQGIPEFHYRPRPVEPGLMKRRLYQIPLEEIEDPTLAALLEAKRDELDRQLSLVADRNTPRFLRGSQQIFGDLEPWLVQLAEEVVAAVAPQGRDGPQETPLDAEAFAHEARAVVSAYRQEWPALPAKVVVRDDVTGIMVSQGNFLIGGDARVPPRRVEAALAHEIGTHVLTYHNGRGQPLQLLAAGLADYEPLQEGLAVLGEYLVGGLDSGRLRQLAGRVLAVHSLEQGADFDETFHQLHETHGFPARSAFSITLRVYRGGGFTKDAVYLRGLARLLKKLGEGLTLESLYLGKVSLDALPLIDELRWRKVLDDGPLRPHFLSWPRVAERLARLQAGMDLQQLIKECER